MRPRALCIHRRRERDAESGLSMRWGKYWTAIWNLVYMRIANYELRITDLHQVEGVDEELDGLQEVGNVNLLLLLFRCGILLEQVADGDVEAELATGFVGNVLPGLEGLAIGIGVGEERDFLAEEGCELVDVELALAA